MPPRTQELTAIFRREKFRSEDGFVIALGDIVNDLPGMNAQAINGHTEHGKPISVSLKGNAEPDELQPGLTYRFYGTRPADDPKWGPQFNFSTFIRATPHGRAGVIRYLSKFSGIGEATAKKLWDKLGGDAVRILREQPDVARAAVDLPHFTDERAAAASDFLRSEQRLESCTIDLIDLLGGRGFPKTTIKKAIQRWGNRAVEIIKRSPYALMAFRGCGFLRCDAMYLELGGNPSSLKRQALCAWHTLAKDSEGNTWQTAEAVIAGLKQKIAGTELRPEVAMQLARRGRILAERRDEFGRLWLAENKRAVAEDRCAEFAAAAMLEGPGEWPALTNDDGLYPHQAAEWAKATASRIGIFTGGGGSGKTYTIARAVGKIIAQHGQGSIALCAPTWAAANRMVDALAEHDVECEAKSIHSTLGVAKRDENNGDGWGFVHNEYFPLEARFILCDEASMNDVSLMAAILAARARGAHILFIGDIHQLPPVGHGAPLRDLILAGIPTGELTEIHRNSGTIVKAGAAMRAGAKTFATDDRIDLKPADGSPPKNFKIIETPGGGAAEQIAQMLRVFDVAKAAGKNPVWDVQVIVAVNGKSELSRKAINKLLQRELNKSGQKVGGNPFLVGDKIVKVERSAFFPQLGRRVESLPTGKRIWWEDDATRNCEGHERLDHAWKRLLGEPLDTNKAVAVCDQGDCILYLMPNSYIAAHVCDGDQIYAPSGVPFSRLNLQADGEVFVSNREVAEVVEVADKFTIARLLRRGDSPIYIKIPRSPGRKRSADDTGDNGGESVDSDQDERRSDEGSDGNEKKTDTGCEWDLAYAITAHISQGSQYPWVIVLIDEYPGAKMIAQKEWTYTAVTRAQELTIGIGSKQTMVNSLRKSALARRKTFLKELVGEKLKELRAGRVIEEIGEAAANPVDIEALCEALL